MPSTLNSPTLNPSTPWPTLERLPSLRAIPSTWRSLMGDEFENFQSAFLQKLPDPAQGFFCEKCYCTHEVIIYGPEAHARALAAIGHPAAETPPIPSPDNHVSRFTHHASRITHHAPQIVAACRCEDGHCPPLELTAPDIEIWSLNWPKLARALCRAFGLSSQFADLKLFNTCQIGAWSADAVPVILTIQSSISHLQSTISQLALRLRRPFILLAPTNGNLDAIAQEFLASASAAFFPLDTTVRLTESGILLPLKTPGELFAKFTPAPKDSAGEDVARQTLALAKALDSEQRFRKAPVFTVFLLYCQEGLNADQIARRCRCARSVVFTRLTLLRRKLGRDLAGLRQHSAQFESIEASLADPRARSIYRPGAAYGDDDAEES